MENVSQHGLDIQQQSVILTIDRKNLYILVHVSSMMMKIGQNSSFTMVEN